ncbi:MAG: hypothetical protein QME41_09935 [Actinomycetota bacterium]|nr:hypothetical protein [Actinomycetota bacterium]
MKKSKLIIVLTASLIIIAVTVALAVGAGYFPGLMVPSNNKTRKITANQAKSMAGKVLSKAGITDTVSTPELVNEQGSKTDSWLLKADKNANVQVDADTGELVSFTNFALLNKLEEEKNGQAKMIFKVKALSLRNQIVKDLGLKIKGKEIDMTLETNGGIEHQAYWSTRWHRETDGYPFATDFISLDIDAFHGQLLGYEKAFHSDEPASTEVLVDEPKARTGASKFIARDLAARGIELSADKGTLIIVRPTYYWTDHPILNTPPTTRLAWKFVLTTEYGDGEIWVDARDGAILGGGETQTAKPK